jgi:hypothetical protein
VDVGVLVLCVRRGAGTKQGLAESATLRYR